MKTYTIMILNDGSTYSDVDKCEIVTITQTAMDMLDEGHEPKDIPESEILLSIHMNAEKGDPTAAY
jgi:hypothetical protein